MAQLSYHHDGPGNSPTKTYSRPKKNIQSSVADSIVLSFSGDVGDVNSACLIEARSIKR
jgi:hypothetical protein